MSERNFYSIQDSTSRHSKLLDTIPLRVSKSDASDCVSRKCDVVNRGLSGYNSRWAKILLPRLIGCQSSADDSISAVTVFFGSNDCALEGTVHSNT